MNPFVSEMELYHLNYILQEPCEDQGWLYMADIPELSGCPAWEETANKPLPTGIARR